MIVGFSKAARILADCAESAASTANGASVADLDDTCTARLALGRRCFAARSPALAPSLKLSSRPTQPSTANQHDRDLDMTFPSFWPKTKDVAGRFRTPSR